MKILLALRTAGTCLAALSVAVTAHAAGTVDASSSTITCSTFTKAVLKPKPTLVVGGTLPATIAVKGQLSGCSTNAPGVTSISGSFKGVLTGVLNDCSGLNSATGTITFKWKSSPGLIDSVSTVTVNANSASFGLFMLSPVASYGQLQLGTPPAVAPLAVAGSFTGGDGGATSTASFIFSQDVNTFSLLCSSGGGIKALDIGVGTVTLQ